MGPLLPITSGHIHRGKMINGNMYVFKKWCFSCLIVSTMVVYDILYTLQNLQSKLAGQCGSLWNKMWRIFPTTIRKEGTRTNGLPKEGVGWFSWMNRALKYFPSPSKEYAKYALRTFSSNFDHPEHLRGRGQNLGRLRFFQCSLFSLRLCIFRRIWQ